MFYKVRVENPEKSQLSEKETCLDPLYVNFHFKENFNVTTKVKFKD